ncbi:MAG: hypothetical protein EOP01_07410, partial [Propionibacteriaceae bacterium]
MSEGGTPSGDVATAPRFDVYDTTLRDGAQQEGLALSVHDKLLVAAHLDELGVGFVEGGWPGAIPRDTEFFARAEKELTLQHAVLAAFGATRKPGVRAGDDPQVRALLDAATPVVTLVAKSDSRHVTAALRTTLEENLAMVADTVALLRREERRVFLDAEHFFDGYRHDPAYALAVVRAAEQAGAEVVVLCDTNGGMLPPWVTAIVTEVHAAVDVPLGIHAHNDTGCAVANSLAAIDAGAMHLQGTLNGDGVGDAGDLAQGPRGQHAAPALELEVGHDRDQVGVARALAVAVEGALQVHRARVDRGEGVRHGAAGVVVGVDAQGHADRGVHLGDDRRHPRRQHPAVGVAQHDHLRARLL